MGKTAVRAIAGYLTPVETSEGVTYVRSKHSIQSSPRLKQFHSCVGSALRGQRGGGRAETRARFAQAAKSCSGRGAPVSAAPRRARF